ncbi:transporter substrate-binding domain-containing protein [Kordiimonas gwangyangensis]|uniref:transporter substrate-binding domain-containing protein n=1 Tax=Kordiimonas gwangyangensis TaxID=288022 RepID=UPI0003741964|nr:transporter substrate-binding domain-containing protein [Kordiimonas gwangyangensis]
MRFMYSETRRIGWIFLLLLLAFGTLGVPQAIADQRPVKEGKVGAASPADLRVQWHLFSFPPAFIESGPLAGQGYQDQILDFFEHKLDGFQIERRHSVLARALANIEHGGAACTSALARTPEREAYMVFSNPILLSLPLRLVVNEHRAAEIQGQLDEAGQAHLSDLATLSHLKGVTVMSRAYGVAIDGWIEDAKAKGGMHTAARPELAFLMLARGRIDYTFAYPDEVGYFMRRHKGKDMMDSLVSIPLADADAAPASHFACSNDATGRAVIEAINHILTTEKPAIGGLAPWQRPYFNWIDERAQADMVRLLHSGG